MAKFIMRKMPDLRGDGRQPLYPKMQIEGTTSLQQLAEEIAARSTFKKGEIIGLVGALSDLMAERMADGQSVRLDGIGLFSATLELAEGAAPETEDGTRRNAASVGVRSVSYRPDRTLVGKTARHCRLQRGKGATYELLLPTREARLAAALAHIEAHGLLHVSDYVRLTGMERTAATHELRELSTEGLLGTSGRRPHLVYVRPA